jgi:hypothetical protein
VFRTLHGDRLREADLRGIGEWGMGVSGGSTSSIGSFVFTALKGTPVSYLVGTFEQPPPDAEHALAFTIEQLK